MMKQQILDKIKEYETIIIHRHVGPDPDAYGSQCGLANIITESFPNKKVYRVGKHEESLRFLSDLDEIDDSIYEGSLVIVVDTANSPRIDDKRFDKGAELIKIDHHPNNDPYGDLVWVDTTASSTSEMICEFQETFAEELTLTAVAARLLFTGIVGDTGRFMFPNTTSRTFAYVSKLTTYEFDRPAIFNTMYKKDARVLHFNGYVLQNFKMSEKGMIHLKITPDLLTEFNVTSNEAAMLINTVAQVEGVKVWVFFVEEPERIRVRIRSKEIVINDIAADYNGGGHPLASGATVYSWEEADRLIADLENACK